MLLPSGECSKGDLSGFRRRGDVLSIGRVESRIEGFVVRLSDELHEDIEGGTHQYRPCPQQQALLRRERDQERLCLLYHLRE